MCNVINTVLWIVGILIMIWSIMGFVMFYEQYRISEYKKIRRKWREFDEQNEGDK